MIDLVTGDQPMVTPSGAVGIVFNGEIYNYRELREALVRNSIDFRTSSDTEVLLQLYLAEGERCVDSLRGMYAFAIWDDRDGTLTLARDRVGKKPLYYQRVDGCLYFASTLSALLAGLPDPPISLHAVDAFLELAYVPAPETIFDGVGKLEAASLMVFGAGALQRMRYFWDLTEFTPFQGRYEDALNELDALLRSAVELRLRSDVPIGVFLSGGVDSSLVTAIAARANPGIRTFSIGFDVAEFDESAHAARVAHELGTEHHAFHVTPDLLTLLPAMVRHFGEPFGDSSALPLWMLAHETRQFATVAIGGDGGDEGFGGYDWYLAAIRFSRAAHFIPARAAAAAGMPIEWLGNVRWAPNVVAKAGRAFDHVAAGDAAAQFAQRRTLISRSEAEFLYAGALREHHEREGAGARLRVADAYRASGGGPLRKMRVADIKTYLADCLMPKSDVSTMAHGLELRAPLLDHKVVEFALSLPEDWLVASRTGKKLLRTLLTRYLPPELFERPKQGLSVPLGAWFQGSARAKVSALPASEPLMATGWFEPGGIARLLREHASGRRDHAERLFNLLVLNEWLAQR